MVSEILTLIIICFYECYFRNATLFVTELLLEKGNGQFGRNVSKNRTDIPYVTIPHVKKIASKIINQYYVQI